MYHDAPSAAAGSFKKQYVSVVAAFDAEGRVSPRAVLWPDGRMFAVDMLVSAEDFGPEQERGRRTMRFRVCVRGRVTDLFLEYERRPLAPDVGNLRWWVYAREGAKGARQRGRRK